MARKLEASSPIPTPAFSFRQILLRKHKGPVPGAEVAYRIGVIENEVPVHPLGHRRRPVTVERQKVQALHRNAESPQLHSKQSRVSAQKKNTRDTISLYATVSPPLMV